MKEINISPVLSQKQYKKWMNCFLTPELGTKEVQPNSVYRDGKQIKLLLLPSVLSRNVYDRTLRSLDQAHFQKGSRRAAYAQKRGGS